MTRPMDAAGIRWTEADFASLSWHDCTIHSMGWDQDGEYQSDFLIDLDFILEWIPDAGGAFQFRSAPAVLRFQNADKLVMKTLLDYKQPMQISEITRVPRDDPGFNNYHWTIRLHTFPGRDNQIELDATGFLQETTAQPVVGPHQSLRLSERLNMIRGTGEQDAPPDAAPPHR